MLSTVNDRARQIVEYLVTSLDTPYHGSSSMTPTVYDTAWLAMVSTSTKHDGETRWLFPECFQSILESQSPEGGFGAQSAEVDEILNTMAALLALCKHEKNPSVTGCPSVPDLASRIARGRRFLEQKLQRWDVRSTVHVGFEILVPNLLDMLLAEGLDFQFPGFKVLMAMNQQKLAKFSPAILYTPHKTTLLHSLEAFIGKIDFDKVAHHLHSGAMMGSPSSTAAYLMNSSSWNPDAEAYLRFVVEAGKGCVPSAFPVSVFEIAWVLSTLLESGFTVDLLGKNNVATIADFLETQLRNNAGITGFAPGILPDADDTAKAILSLNLLGRPTGCEKMIESFEAQTHFKTYDFETTESFSANCNVLTAILQSKNPSNHLSQLSKALDFLCQTWYHGELNDKWNLERQYSMLLLAGSLTQVVKLWDTGALADLPPDLIAHRIPLVTFQILVRTLSAQSEQGSWKGSPEITAYALLTLKKLASLPWTKTLEATVNDSILRGTRFLEANETKWNRPGFIWVEKVSYGSGILSETYCLAALQASSAYNWGENVLNLWKIDTKAVDKFSQFFSKLPIFSQQPKWKLRASIVEGYLFAPLLHQTQPDIFPRKDRSGDKYREYIPFTWTLCNNATDFGISTQTMCDMMVLSMLNFQADEYLEQATEHPDLKGNFGALRAVIRRLFDSHGQDMENGHPSHTIAQSETHQSKFLLEVEQTLYRFISYVLNHPKVSGSSEVVHRRIRQELSIFLQAHVTHGEDNTRLRKPASPEKLAVFTSARGTYYDWVRTTSADHTSCPYSFEFFRCLIAPSGGDCFSGALSRYLAQDVCRHLATMCRQYNDYGSIARDRAENNLNSANFPEFHEQEEDGSKNGYPNGLQTDSSSESTKLADEIRQTLLQIASYERECLDLAVQKLKPEVDPQTWKAVQVFINVTDLYGQIYVVRDIHSRMTK
ncbi:hypothetical protein VTN96DRAFT_2512 [Rasamsonia emersonii]